MDKIKDKVSVIIPVYNSEKTIVQVLDSVKRQTRFDYICEILVINDGSKDQSEELIQNYICEHSELPISYYSKENGGASSARILECAGQKANISHFWIRTISGCRKRLKCR